MKRSWGLASVLGVLAIAIAGCQPSKLPIEELPQAGIPVTHEGMTFEPELTTSIVDGIKQARFGDDTIGVSYLHQKCVSAVRVLGIDYPKGTRDQSVFRDNVLQTWRAGLGIPEGGDTSKSGWSFLVHKGLTDSFEKKSESGGFYSVRIMPTSDQLMQADLDRLESQVVRRKSERLMVLVSKGKCPESP